MKIISFRHTAPALLAGQKTVTRRSWQPAHAHGFSAGDTVQAWDQSPRVGGVQIGTIKLESDPVWEPISQMPDGDYQREGLSYLQGLPNASRAAWALAKQLEIQADFAAALDREDRAWLVQREHYRVLFDTWRRMPGLWYWKIEFQLVGIVDQAGG